MRFLYRYQDRERGVLEGEIAASSESDAYAVLRKSGVRPMKVWPAPGVLNRISSIGKRGATIILLALAVLLSVVYLIRARNEVKVVRGELQSAVRPLSRRQVQVDVFRFQFRSENALVGFARPGDSSRIPTLEEFSSDLVAALRSRVGIEEGEDDGVVELKKVVAGLKEEVRIAMASGETVSAAYERMVARQRMEHEYRESAVRRVAQGASDIGSVNGVLSTMGFARITEAELEKAKNANSRNLKIRP